MALLHVEFFSDVLRMAVSADVILPQTSKGEIGIDSAENMKNLLPVLWLLHGSSDDHTTWQRRTSIERYTAPLGLAVVMPNAHLSSYATMAHGGNFYQFISQELVQSMRSMFPLSYKREDNYIAGNSMGGYGAMKIGINHPDQYEAIGCFSAGALNEEFIRQKSSINSEEKWKKRNLLVYGERKIAQTDEDTWYMADKFKHLPILPRIFHSCGNKDFLIDKARKTRDFFESMPGNPYQYQYEEHEGVHEWDYWDTHITDFLKFIQKVPKNSLQTVRSQAR